MKNTEEKQERGNYRHKVGIKILSDTQLTNVLPTYQNLFAKIEDCREVARNEMAMTGKRKRHYQYNFMYDNVFSILGKRGTGKTSVAFTLREKIMSEGGSENQDVVLPLVIPEVIPENCTILGWLLAIVREEISQLEQDIEKLRGDKESGRGLSRYGYYGDRQTKESLIETLDEISQMFFAGSYNPSNEKSYYRVIDNSIQQAADYHNFAIRIAELWDKWITRIQDYYNMKNSNKKENICPMIYFVFDDVDLAPDKISELLSVIIKYLSHPNIIVIVTAEENLFLQVIENQLDRKIGRLPREWREYLNRPINNLFDPWENEMRDQIGSNEDVVNQTAAMYLGKVLPPSTRYYLRLFHTAKQKGNFYVEGNKTLWRAVCDKIEELIQYSGSSCVNFIMPNAVPLSFYWSFLGDTSRQINNVYIALNEFITSLEKIVDTMGEDQSRAERCMNMLYQACRYFLCVALISNHELAKIINGIEQFVDEILLFEYNQWNLYVNYSYINEFLEDTVDDKKARVVYTLQLYSVCAFVENILVLMEGAFPDGLAGRKEIHAIPLLPQYIQDMAFDHRHIFRDDLPADTFFEHYDNLLNRLESIVADEERSEMKFRIAYFYDFRNYKISLNEGSKRASHQVDEEELKKVARQNPAWFKELVGMLTMVYGNAYLFTREDVRNCIAFLDKKYLVLYQQRIRKELQNHMQECFDYIRLQDMWEMVEERLLSDIALEKPDKERKGFYDLLYKVKREVEMVKDINSYYIGEEDEEIFGEEESDSSGEDQQTEREELVNVDLEQNESRFVNLQTVIDQVFENLDLENTILDQGFLSKLISKFPDDIAQELLKDLQRIRSDNKSVKQILAHRIMSIEKKEYNRYGFTAIFDLEHVVDVFDRLYKVGGSKYKTLKEIGNEISQYAAAWDEYKFEEDLGKMTLLPRSLYRQIISELNRVLEISGNERYNEGEVSALLNDAEEIFKAMDWCVDIYDDVEMREAVRLGIEVTVIAVLEQIYIYQTIHDRYVNRNSFSSVELEQVDGQNTYYCNFFNRVANVLEHYECNQTDEDLEEKVRLAFAYERNKYFEQLMAGIENE